jgi:hypothetical protein
MSSAAKSRPATRTLERVSSESQLSAVHDNGRVSTLVLRLSPKSLPQRRYARGNERELDLHGDDQRRSGADAFLCPGAAQYAPSAVRRGAIGSLPPVRLGSRVRDQPGVANASAWAHRGVHPSSRRGDPSFPRPFPLRPLPSPRL